MVQLATQGSRGQADGLIWFGWNQGDEQHPSTTERIQFGSQGIMFTAQVAQELLEGMGTSTPGHFDQWLRDRLEWVKLQPPGTWAYSKWSACVCPPVGNFAPHFSHNNGKIQPGFWKEKWCVGGSVRDWGPDNSFFHSQLLLFFVSADSASCHSAVDLPTIHGFIVLCHTKC